MPEPRRKIATGFRQLADLYPGPGGDLMACAIRKVGEHILQGTRYGTARHVERGFRALEPGSQRAQDLRSAVTEVCAAMELVAKPRPVLANDLRPRIGVENRLPEFIEEALRLEQVPDDLLGVLRRTSQAAVEHLADRFFRCMRRDECDRMVELVASWDHRR